MMKAAHCNAYGSADVVDVRDAPLPRIKDNDVLVKVVASSVTTADWRFRAGAFPGIFWLSGRLMFGVFGSRRQILGGEFAGRIASVGRRVRRFKEGDEVFGFSGHGAHAEYLAMPDDGPLALKPKRLGFDEAAATPFGAHVALTFLRDVAKVRRGQRVLITGAAGGVGVFAIQLAKRFGAEVTGVCSTNNLALVRALGADHVIDRSREDFTAGGPTYDLIFDTVGASSFARCRRALKANGVYLPLEFGLREIAQGLLTSLVGGRRLLTAISSARKDDLDYLRALLERGDIRPVIDRRYPLDRIAEAHRFVEQRRKRGSVVIMIDATVLPCRQAAHRVRAGAEPSSRPATPVPAFGD